MVILLNLIVSNNGDEAHSYKAPALGQAHILGHSWSWADVMAWRESEDLSSSSNTFAHLD